MGRMFGGGGASTLPAYARPQPLLSVQAVAVAALVRGSFSAALGRADEAAAAYAWVTEVAAEGGEAAAAISRREVQTVAYSHYERAVLYADGAKALARRAAAARSPAAAAAAARRVPLVLPCDLVGDAGGAAAAAAAAMAVAAGPVSPCSSAGRPTLIPPLFDPT